MRERSPLTTLAPELWIYFRQSNKRLLLHGDEYPLAGGTSHHRTYDRLDLVQTVDGKRWGKPLSFAQKDLVQRATQLSAAFVQKILQPTNHHPAWFEPVDILKGPLFVSTLCLPRIRGTHLLRSHDREADCLGETRGWGHSSCGKSINRIYINGN